jgi:regulator of nonsense transcripts 3
MTVDKQDSRRNTREAQQLRKKSESSVVSIKDCTEGNSLPSKIVLRRLPPSWTEDTFIEHISPVPEYDYLYFVPADLSYGQCAFSHAYINIVNNQDVAVFLEKFDGYVFVDERGCEYPASVEFAPFPKVPKKRSRKADPRKGTIEADSDYLKFLESLQHAEHEVIPSPETFLEEIEQREKLLKENAPVTTPLIEFMMRRKEEKKLSVIQAREEKHKKELERRKREEELRKLKEKQRQRDKERQRLHEADERDRVQSTSIKLLKNPEREKVEKEKGKLPHSVTSTDGQQLSKSTGNRDKDKTTDKYKLSSQKDKQLLRHKEQQQVEHRSYSKADSANSGGATSSSQSNVDGSALDDCETGKKRVQEFSSKKQEHKLAFGSVDSSQVTVAGQVNVVCNPSDDCNKNSALLKQKSEGLHTDYKLSGRDGRDARSYRDAYGTRDGKEHSGSVRHVREDRSQRKDDKQGKHQTGMRQEMDGKPYRDGSDFKRDRDQDSSSQLRLGKVVKDIKSKKEPSSCGTDKLDASVSTRVREMSTANEQDVASRDQPCDIVYETCKVTSDRSKTDELSDNIDKVAMKATDAADNTASRHRIRYKDRPERAIYNPARRAVERSKDTPSATGSQSNTSEK